MKVFNRIEVVNCKTQERKGCGLGVEWLHGEGHEAVAILIDGRHAKDVNMQHPKKGKAKR